MNCWNKPTSFPSLVAILHILFVTVLSEQTSQNDSHLINRTDEICSKVCSKSFNCNWSTWHNRLEYVFPDGTLQTCVGAQVRCGCTFSMEVISYISYEHPTAVVLPFLFLATVAVIFLLTRIARSGCGCFFMCPMTSVQNPKPCNSYTDLYGENSNYGIVVSDIISISRKLSKVGIDMDEPPPPYSTLKISIDQPPPYSQCN